MTVLQSSQNFVRALKASTDPPVEGGPLKISLAEQAWQETSFYVPNKAEVIADWLLTKLFKERGNEFTDNPIVDKRYWILLLGVVSSNHGAESFIVRQSNTWLRPLLSRISIVPILMSFINLLHDVAGEERERLAMQVSSCMSSLWLIGTQKMGTEALLECFGTLLTKMNGFESYPGILHIGTLITESYRNSLSNSSGKKKIQNAFLQNQSYFCSWLGRISYGDESISQYDLFRNSTFRAGIETIFNIDTLRQAQDAKDETPLFRALRLLIQEHRSLVLGVLPKFFSQYIIALRRYRGALFSQGSRQVPGATMIEAHSAALQFFASCQAFLNEGIRDLDTWTIAFELLEIIAEEHLYDSKSSEATLLLTHNLELVLDALSEGWKEEMAITTKAIQCLTVITQIDYDLILPSTAHILTRMLCIPESLPEHFAFLDLLLDFHIKTRSLNEYIDTIFSCLPLKNVIIPGGSHQRYQISFGSPILHAVHLEKLARAIHKFLTPSQCPTSADRVFKALKGLREHQKSAERQQDSIQGKGSRKKRKSEGMPVDTEAMDPDVVAVTFSLTARVSQIVLSSLPLRSLPSTERDELKTSIAEFQESFVRHTLSKSLKTLCKKETDDSWATQIVVVATLRLQYALAMSRNLALPSAHDEKLTKRMLEALEDDELLPELCLEIFRTLLHQSFDMESSDVQQTIDRVLEYLETKLPRTNISWSGKPHHLNFGQPGKAESALALLHMVLERWIAVVDALASRQQLERLIRVLVSIPLRSTTSLTKNGPLIPELLLLRTLHSAEFWEMHGIRSAFLVYLNEITSMLDIHQPKSSAEKPNASDLVQIISTYTLLLYFPIEYFTKSSRGDLVKRALNADLLVSQFGGEGGDKYKEHGLSVSILEVLSVLRVFLKRVFTHTGSVEQVMGDGPDYLLHLLEDPISETVNDLCVETTLDLANLYFVGLFRSASKCNDGGGLSKVLSSYSRYQLYDNVSRPIRARSMIRMMELLVKDFSLTSFSEESKAAFRDLHAHLVSTLLPKMTVLVDQNVPEDTSDLMPDLVSGWHALLCMGKWLGLDNVPQYFGRQLSTKFNPNFLISCDKPTSWSDNISVMTLAVLLQELYFQDAMEQNEHLDFVIAKYISSLKTLSPTGRTRLDEFIGNACRTFFSPASFAHVLRLIEEALTSAPEKLGDSIVDLVHLATVLLREHPQNTLRIMQGFVTQCLNAFNGDDLFVSGSVELRIQVLNFVLQHLTDRPASLRPLDMNGIWSLLFKFLSPSSTHDTQTTHAIFHKITGITGSLIRFRRDLVLPTLPHLGMILRRLLLSMRGCKPQLGTKQRELVMKTQPKWVTSGEPLGVEEGKMLSRLLETLTTKTVVRTHGGGGGGAAPVGVVTGIASMGMMGETQKAESLVNPFSKHAAYVLKAYMESMNEPLCVIPLEVRKEMESGLFALCGMMNEHGRDAMMVSGLDGGGKAIMKGLWKEYEKQRYVGKG